MHTFETLAKDYLKIGLLAGLWFAVSAGVVQADQGKCRIASAGQMKETAADCGAYDGYRVQNGNCKHTCQVQEKIAQFAVDLKDVGATTGKRVWTAKAQHSFTYHFNKTSGGLFNCNNKNETKNRNQCESYWNSVRSQAAAGRYDDINAYCPDASKSEFRVQGLTVNPSQMCSQYDPEMHCNQYRPDRDYQMYSDGQCPSDPYCSYGTSSNDPDCCGYTGGLDQDWSQYFSCYNTYGQQYDQCYANIVNDPGNSNAGPTDCYCKSDTEYFKFDTAIGSWKCIPCEEAGYTQDRSTGMRCKSPCSPSQTWDPATQSCQSMAQCTADPTKEVWPAPPAVGGACVTRCSPSQQRDAQGVCRDACPRGMTLTTTGGVQSCTCNDPNFTGVARVPVRQSAVSGLRYPVWTAGGVVAPSSNPDHTMSCACIGDTANPSRVSMMDFIEAISDPNFRTLPIGPVSIVSNVQAGGGGGASQFQYSCGCPNFNEQFRQDPADSRWKCMPAIGRHNAQIDGRVLAAVADPGASGALTSAQAAEAGIIAGLSHLWSRPLAMVRSQVTSMDTSASYRRKVWRCAEGFRLNASNECKPIAEDPAMLAQNNCSDALPTIRPSSSYLTAAAVTPATFGNLTNRMLACCMGQKVDPLDPSKFHCVGNQASAYPNFDEFYDAGAAGGVDFGGITTPNRLFLRDNGNNPVPGVYTRSGTRCGVLNALTPTQQLAALGTVRTNIRADATLNPFRGIAGVNANVTEQQECRFVVRTALEVVCPPEGPDADGNLRTIAYNRTDPTYLATGNRVRRCFQPDALRVHYAIEDMTDPNQTRRAAFRTISSIGQGSEPAGSVDIQRLIRQNP